MELLGGHIRFLALLTRNDSSTSYFAVIAFQFSYCQKNRIDKRKRFLEHRYIGLLHQRKSIFAESSSHDSIKPR